jgi:hypothetical protein
MMALYEVQTETVSFPAVYGLVGDITHVSVEITRIPGDVLDTMPTEALLLSPEIELKRM